MKRPYGLWKILVNGSYKEPGWHKNRSREQKPRSGLTPQAKVEVIVPMAEWHLSKSVAKDALGVPGDPPMYLVLPPQLGSVEADRLS